MLFEFSTATPVAPGAAISPVGSVPMKQPEIWAFPGAVTAMSLERKCSISRPETRDPDCAIVRPVIVSTGWPGTTKAESKTPST